MDTFLFLGHCITRLCRNLIDKKWNLIVVLLATPRVIAPLTLNGLKCENPFCHVCIKNRWFKKSHDSSFSDFDGMTSLHRNDLLASKDHRRIMSLHLGCCLSRAECTYSEEWKKKERRDKVLNVFAAVRGDLYWSRRRWMLHRTQRHVVHERTGDWLQRHKGCAPIRQSTTYDCVRIYGISQDIFRYIKLF